MAQRRGAGREKALRHPDRGQHRSKRTVSGAGHRRERQYGGISAGAAVFAAVELAKRTEMKNKNIVVILPDSAERYLSIDGFA